MAETRNTWWYDLGKRYYEFKSLKVYQAYRNEEIENLPKHRDLSKFERYLLNNEYKVTGASYYSTVVPGGLTRTYEKEGHSIYYGLRDVGVPPHLLVPYGQTLIIGYTKDSTYKSDDIICTLVEQQLSNEDIESALVNKHCFVYNYENETIGLLFK